MDFPPESLRVLIADQSPAELDRTAAELDQLGHEVVSRHIRLDEVVNGVRRHQPDVAVVAVAEDTEHALELIRGIVDAIICPVVALLDSANPALVRRAADLGLVAFASPGAPAALQSAIELALRRYGDMERLSAEVDQLQGALSRRVRIERAKGVLMERHDVEEEEAYRLLRDHARRHRRSLEEAADEVLRTRRLLPSRDAPPSG